MDRIVITGMGAVSPLGCGVETAWRRLLAGRSGIRRLPDDIVEGVAAKIGGVVPSVVEDPDGGFDPDQAASPKDQRKMDRFILLALAAARQAVTMAGWSPSNDRERERSGTMIASGIGGFPAIARAVRTTDQEGPRRLSP
ncbi:MAG TPA: beta-ketoacyl synthase N-terminal-like domain-containing protein, partial [Caulobacteraceae bacterium]|nr:beta-ketoacyl synthase N-terminal-like domain-containing protein [Caulobacteraceae bacterium]